MTWVYKIDAGEMRNGDQVFEGYTGKFGPSRDNPDYCRVACVGPIPTGSWEIGEPVDSVRMGPRAIPLTARTGTETFGRNGFYIHGDSLEHPGRASDGCIILSRAAREVIVASPDKNLEVIP